MERIQSAEGDQLPLVGRAEELDAVVRGVLTGTPAVVIAGGAGIGKSRLLKEAVIRLEERNHVAHWLPTGTATAEIPFAAFASFPTAAATAADPLITLGRITRTLGTASARRRLVFVIDDAHLLDEPSAALVQRMAATGKVSALCSIRAGAAAPDAVTALWKDGLARRIDLAPLTQQQLGELAAGILGGPLSTAAGMFLWEVTQGNALLVRELILAAAESGSLRPYGPMWHWDKPLEVSNRLAEVVAAETGRLGQEELAVLEMLAQSAPLEAAVLEASFSESVLTSVDRRGLIATDVDGRRVQVRLASPLVGHVLRARTPVLRARAIRRELSEIIARTGARRRGDQMRLVGWRLDSGESGPAELLLTAAEEALAALDFDLAERIAQAAVDHGIGPHALIALARARYGLGQPQRALPLLADCEPAVPTDLERAWTAILQAQALCWGQGRAADAVAALDRAAARITAEAHRGRVSACRSAVLLAVGQVAEAAAEAGAQRADSEAARIAGAVVSCTQAMTGGPADPIPDGQPSGFELGNLLPYAVFSLRRRPLAAVVEWTGEQHRAALARKDTWSAAGQAACLGRLVLDQGRAELARRWLWEAVATLARRPHPVLQTATLAWLAEANALLGDLPAAADACQQAMDGASVAGPFCTDLALAEAWLAAVSGNLSGARKQAAVAGHAAVQAGQPVAAVFAWHTVVRLGGDGAAAEALAELAAAAGDEFTGLRARHARVLADGEASGLERVSASLLSSGATLAAAEARAQAAALHTTAGHRSRALTCGAAARDMLRDCTAPCSPALMSLKAPHLTERERQIALMAARAMPSKSIAEELSLSIRTIDNHLQSAYAKLGIRSRRGLSEALGLLEAEAFDGGTAG